MNLYNLLSDGEIDEQTFNDTLEAMAFTDRLEDKAEAYAKIIKLLEANAAAADSEAKRLAERKVSFANNAKRLKDNLYNTMKLTRHEKFKTPLFSFGIQANAPAVEIFSESKLPSEYFRVKREPDKSAIKDALKAGKDVAGCRLVQGESLRIR